MIMQRGMVRIILGFILVSHAANLMFFAASNTAFRGVPYIGTSDFGEGRILFRRPSSSRRS